MSRTKELKELIAVPPFCTNVVVDKHERRNARQRSCAVEVDLVHGFNTKSPSAERGTQGRSLSLDNCD